MDRYNPRNNKTNKPNQRNNKTNKPKKRDNISNTSKPEIRTNKMTYSTSGTRANNTRSSSSRKAVNTPIPGYRNIKKQKNERIANRKLHIMLSIFFICFFGLTVRMLYIHIVKGEEYMQKAITQQTNKYDTIIPPIRGSIVDRNKKVLALSTVVYNVILDVRLLHEINDGLIKGGADKDIIQPILEKLNEILNIPHEELQSFVAKDASGQLKNDKNYLKIAEKISQEKANELDAAKLKAVWMEKDSERKYLNDSLAAQLIGFVRGGSTWGLERLYNKHLTGLNGRAFITFEDGRNVTNQQVDPIDGYTIVTTIDQTIQKIAEDAIKKAVIDFEGQNTSVIVMKPTGELLAMAEYPTFNLNEPTQPEFIIPGAELEFEAKTESEKIDYLNECWKNFNVSSTFEPGSIFKPITVAAALEENIISVNDTYDCTGGKFVVDKDIPCNKVHGIQTLEQALANSCNVAMMDIAAKLQRDLFYKYQIDFGFGQETGVDLPSEVSAADLMYTPAFLNPVELATESFGQSFNVTALQAINSIATIINGGNLMRPYVVSQIYDHKGNVVYENMPEIQRKVISQETADTVREFMRSVVDNGTGYRAHIPGYAIGGKTGTAQQGRRDEGKHTVSFISFLPVDNPQILVMTTIHLPKEYQEGVTTASYLMKEVLENTIKYLAIPPVYKDDEEQQSLVADEVILEDYTGKDLLEISPMLEAKELTCDITGAGTIITKQIPKSGTAIKAGAKILFYVQKDEQGTIAAKVPYVVGKTYDEAVAEIMSANLAPVTEFEITGDISNKIITMQSVKAGIFLKAGSEVIIDITENASE